jgi:hypothetical protein
MAGILWGNNSSTKTSSAKKGILWNDSPIETPSITKQRSLTSEDVIKPKEVERPDDPNNAPWYKKLISGIFNMPSGRDIVKSAAENIQEQRKLSPEELAERTTESRTKLLGQPIAYAMGNIEKEVLGFNQGLTNALAVAAENTPLKFIPGVVEKLKEPQNKFEEMSQAIDESNRTVSKEQKFLGDVISSTTQMVPSVLMSFINPVLGTAAFGIPAAGQYARQAELEGANPGRQMGIGAIGGATEALFGGIFVKQLAKMLPKGVLDETVKTGTKNMLKNLFNIGKNTAKAMAIEGIEEGAIDPVMGLAQKVVYDKDKGWIGPGGVIDPKQIGYDALLGAAIGGGFSAPSIPFNVADAIEAKRYIEENYDDTLATAQGLPEEYASHKKAVEYTQNKYPISYDELVDLQQQTAKDLIDYAAKKQAKEETKAPEPIKEPVEQKQPSKISQKLDALKKIRMGVRQGTAEHDALTDSIERLTKELQDEITTPIPGRAEELAEELRGLSKTPASSAESIPDNTNIPSTGKTDSVTSQNKTLMSEREVNTAGKDALISDRKVKAYMFENPEIKDYFQLYAKYILDNEFVANEQFEAVTDVMKKLKADTGLTPAQIKDALERLTVNRGHENAAAAKRVEIVIDDMLSNGFYMRNGNKVPPMDDYLEKKSIIEGVEIKPREETSVIDDLPMEDDFAKPVERIKSTDQIGIAGVNVRDIKSKDGSIEKMISPYGQAAKNADGTWTVQATDKADVQVKTEAEARNMIDSGMERTEVKAKKPTEESEQMEIGKPAKTVIETGKPFESTMYHGKGKTASEIYRFIQYPIAGEGSYYAFDKKSASNYGKDITSETVKINNPMVIKDDKDWRNLVVDKVGWKYPNLVGMDDVKAIKDIKALKDYLVSRGYDGLIVSFEKDKEGDVNSRTGNAIKTLLNVFGHDQAVVYNKTVKPEKSPSVQGYSVQELTGTSDEFEHGDDSSTEAKTVDDIIEVIEKTIGVPIRTGKYKQKARGIFKIKPEVIRTKVRGDMPVVSHELGHYFDKKHKFSESKKFKSELMALGRRTSKPSYDPKQVRAEGVAEFVRLYLTNPNRAYSMAPKFLAEFEKSVDADTIKFLAELRKDISNIVNLPHNKKIFNDVSDFETRKSTDQSIGLLQKLYDSWINDRGPFKRMQQYAEEKGWTGKNIDILTQNYSGFEAKALYMMFDKQRDLDGNVIGDSFMEILESISKKEVKKAGGNPLQVRKDFISYLISRRAMDYKDRGLVMPQPFYVYEDNIADMDAEYPEFEHVFNMLRIWENNNLNLLVESGIRTAAQIDDIKFANVNHVPLYRIREAANAIRAGSGNTLGQSKKVIKKAIGSGATIIDPLESMIADSFIIRRAAESNSILRELKNMSREVEGIGMMVEKVDIKGEVTKFTVEEVKGQLNKMADLIKAESGDSTFKDALENMDEKYLETMLSIYKPLYKEGDNEVTIYDNGKAELYQVDPELYKAIKGLNKEQSHFILRMLNIPKRVLQFGAVTTVDFVMRNMARDTGTSSIQSEAGINPVDIFKGYVSAIKKDKWFKEWIATGGASEYLNVNDRTQAQKIEDDVLGFGISEKWGRLTEAIAEMRKNNNGRTQAKVKNTAKQFLAMPFDFIRDMVQWSEAGPRVAEFRKAVEKGESTETAASWSRQVSQDFLRHGYYGKELNKITAFFNAGVQGVTRIAESLDPRNPKKMTRTLARGFVYITLPSMLLYFFNHDDEDYQNLPEWKKALYFNIPVGNGRFISIPKPYGYGFIFGALPEIAMDKILKDDPKTWKRIAESFTLHFSIPFVPAVIKPIVDVYANLSWNKTPIEGKYERENKPAYLISDDKTSAIANLIGDIAKNEKGVSPKQIDYLIRGYTGSVGRFFLRLPDTIKEGIERPTDVTQYPVIKAFITDSAYTTASINNFYDYGKELSVRLGELKETGKYSAMEHLPKEKQAELFDMLEGARVAYNDLAEQFTEARKAIREIKASKTFTPAEKEHRERQIHIAMNKMAAGFNKTYEEFKKANGIK